MELLLLLSGFLKVASQLSRPDLPGLQGAVIESLASPQPGMCSSRGSCGIPAPLSPPGLCQDGGTARLLPGRPRAPGRAGPRALLTGSAEVEVAGLQGAPLLQEGEYLPPPTLEWERAQEMGGQRACLISADRKRCLAGPGECGPRWLGVSVPPLL